jgi:hypothetical protein
LVLFVAIGRTPSVFHGTQKKQQLTELTRAKDRLGLLIPGGAATLVRFLWRKRGGGMADEGSFTRRSRTAHDARGMAAQKANRQASGALAGSGGGASRGAAATGSITG